jgi:hypothetical protein
MSHYSNFLEIDEKLNYHLGIIQTSFAKSPHDNNNNIKIWSFFKIDMKTYFLHNIGTKNYIVLVN